MDNIVNKTLYEKVNREADLKYKRAGLYKSSWIQKRYQELGGTYRGPKPSSETGITRWLKKEQWVQVGTYLKTGKKIQCGSSDGKNIACRPFKRANSETPITLPELIKLHGKSKLLGLSEEKEKNPSKRINWKNGTIS